MNNFALWMEIYEIKLMEVVSDPKNGYCYGPGEVPGVVSKMRKSFALGDYNKDGLAIKKTCKHFNIPYTYKSINGFIAGE